MKKFQILIFLCSIFFSTIIFADDDSHKKNHIYKNLDFLDLTKLQQSKIRHILINYKRDYKKYYKAKEEAEDEIEDIVKSEVFDELKYVNILRKIKLQAIRIEVKNIKEIHKILTSTQRKKFSHYLEDWEVE